MIFSLYFRFCHYNFQLIPIINSKLDKLCDLFVQCLSSNSTCVEKSSAKQSFVNIFLFPEISPIFGSFAIECELFLCNVMWLCLVHFIQTTLRIHSNTLCRTASNANLKFSFIYSTIFWCKNPRHLIL